MTLEAIVAGTTYPLDAGAALAGTGKIYWQAEQGVGMSPLQRLVHRAPRQHGDKDVGRRLEPRQIRQSWKIIADTWSDMYDSRDYLLDIFKPLHNIPVTMKWTLPNGKERRIDTYTVGAMSMDQRASDGPSVMDVIVDLRADDPTFYDPITKLAQYSVEDIGELSFPIGFPIGFGISLVSGGQTVQNNGTWIVYPIIKFTGPLQNPIISNDSLSPVEEIQLLTTITAGQTWVIDLSPLEKTVVDHVGANKIGTVSDASDIGTFRLEIDPVVTNGNNTISVIAGGSTPASLVEISWQERFIGM